MNRFAFLIATFVCSTFLFSVSAATAVSAVVTDDWDSDGMPNTWEQTYGLNPNNAADASLDNDLDGLTNLEEYNRGTNPIVADTDSGGVNDGDEVLNGTDPLNPADDGVVSSYSPPKKESPTDSDGDGLSDIREKHYGTNPHDPDTDRDGINDYDEIFKYKTNPNSSDTDLDGLNDYDEIFKYKTNPNFFDTDLDGFSDGDEIKNGTNPLVKNDHGSINVSYSIGTAQQQPIDLYGETFVIDTVVDMEFKISVSTEKNLTGSLVSFNNQRVLFKENNFEKVFISPADVGQYRFILQFLNENGTVDTLEKIVNVRPRGQLLATYNGSFNFLLNLFNINKTIPFSSSRVELFSFNKGVNDWLLYDYSKAFGFSNPQFSDKNAHYVFYTEPGRYKVAVYNIFNQKVYTSEVQKNVKNFFNDKLVVKVDIVTFLMTALFA